MTRSTSVVPWLSTWRIRSRQRCWNDRVADREHLVDEQDVGLEVGGDGEAEAHLHAARVELHLAVDGVLELGELDDLVEASRDLACA